MSVYWWISNVCFLSPSLYDLCFFKTKRSVDVSYPWHTFCLWIEMLFALLKYPINIVYLLSNGRHEGQLAIIFCE